MTESKQKVQDFLNKFDTLQDAIQCTEEIIEEHKLFPYNTIFYERKKFWQEVLTHLNEML